ncbi:MAG: DUF2946 family protein [Alphaproteobacteria bacterium]|nr:DUF2946 family protein [Alphaproteobacteria bacterium]MBU1280114.1 DUF2946 family protein [Alphaproteobacteria bacterium]MBU1573547.1 DUF2946 family protein [Alphaproteobacteria bacterium]MBU1830005.1 DUF2946 family protein [Alphaproteobacteria bacterium]MBU2079139.1 DUF2946 family protein [Alphaproteobacteria bacterium]
MNMRALHGFWAVCLSILLTVQISIAFQPDARADVILSDSEVLLQLCGTPGNTKTLIFDTNTGAVRDVPNRDGTQSAHCPYCVVGAAFFVADITAPCHTSQARSTTLPFLAAPSVIATRRDFSRSTRAPPLFV